MLAYRKVLQLSFEEASRRTVSASTSHSRNTVSEIFRRVKQGDLQKLDNTITKLGRFLFPEKQNSENGYAPVDWKWMHKKLQKIVILALIPHEYTTESRADGKAFYAYRTHKERENKCLLDSDVEWLHKH